jgi:peptidyl-prolyl cis-trans isomerase B (cyclophilin B)
MRKLISFGLISLLVITLLSGCGSKNVGVHHVEIEVENYGVIKVELNGDIAPITVKNFISLAKDGFYDGLTFHRIIDGFMIQGGDPNADGPGGSAKKIKGEFSANGVENNISHVRGVISMARKGENPYTGEKNYNSASSQFFIVHRDAPHLNGKYAAFGFVTEGMEIVDAICKDTPVTDSNGTVVKSKQPVIKEIRVID